MSKPPPQVDRIARIKITLDHSKPVVWRRVEAPLTTSLRGLHEVIQAAMLFENYHLFGFTVQIDGEPRRYGIPDPDGGADVADAKNIKLGALIDRGVTRLAYTYDFGDNWEHTLAIEAITDADPAHEYPRFIKGERRAPPEDVGGIPGFEDFIEAMTDLNHPERSRLIEWYGQTFKPEDIGIDQIKARTAKLARRRTIGKAAFAKSRAAKT